MVAPSCSDDNEIEQYQEQRLAEKVQLLNDFQAEARESPYTNFGLYVGEKYLGDIGTNFTIKDGRYVVIGTAQFDLLHLVGYAIGGNHRGLYFSN